VQIGSVAHAASYPMRTVHSFTGVIKRPVRESDKSPLSSAEVKNELSCALTSPYVFMTWCLFKHRDSFTFTVICMLCSSRNSIPTSVFEAVASENR
jgi:hypothetical protein